MPDHREKKERREKKRVRNHFRKRFFTWSRTFCLQGSYLGTRFIPPCRFSFGEKGGKAKSRGRPNRPIYKRLTLVLNERTQRRGTRSTHHIRLSARNRTCFFSCKNENSPLLCKLLFQLLLSILRQPWAKQKFTIQQWTAYSERRVIFSSFTNQWQNPFQNLHKYNHKEGSETNDWLANSNLLSHALQSRNRKNFQIAYVCSSVSNP